MRRLLTLLLLAALQGACAIWGGSDRFLDATRAVVRPEPGHVVEAGGISSSHPPPRGPYPLRLHLLKTDRRTYRRMETIAYDVRVQNVSDTPFVMPWSPLVMHRRDRPASGYRHAFFELVIVDLNGRDNVVDIFVLYGAPNVPGSLKEIAPGRSVTLRLPATLSGGGFTDERNPVLFPTPGLRTRVGMTVFAPDDARFKYFHEEFSGNTLPIAIAPTIRAVPDEEASAEGANQPYVAPLVDGIRVGPSDQVVMLHDRPTRPERFEIAQGDLLVFHFADPSPSRAIVYLRGPSRSLRLEAVRDKAYPHEQQLEIRLPQKLPPGLWRITLQLPSERIHHLPIAMWVHPRPE